MGISNLVAALINAGHKGISSNFNIGYADSSSDAVVRAVMLVMMMW